MVTRNPTATDLSHVSNVADATTAKNVQRVKTHQQPAHYAEEITPQTTGGVNTTTAYLKNPIYTETSHNAHTQRTPIQMTTPYNLATTHSNQEATQTHSNQEAMQK